MQLSHSTSDARPVGTSGFVGTTVRSRSERGISITTTTESQVSTGVVQQGDVRAHTVEAEAYVGGVAGNRRTVMLGVSIMATGRRTGSGRRHGC